MLFVNQVWWFVNRDFVCCPPASMSGIYAVNPPYLVTCKAMMPICVGIGAMGDTA
jgi:hypothetical protein